MKRKESATKFIKQPKENHHLLSTLTLNVSFKTTITGLTWMNLEFRKLENWEKLSQAEHLKSDNFGRTADSAFRLGDPWIPVRVRKKEKKKCSRKGLRWVWKWSEKWEWDKETIPWNWFFFFFPNFNKLTVSGYFEGHRFQMCNLSGPGRAGSN